METMSLKALAAKVLTGNPEGNSQETKSFLGGKQNGKKKTTQETKVMGYGCGACGIRIYRAVKAWEIGEMPETSPWTYEHSLSNHWKCEGCGTVYEIIGGSKGPELIN